MTTTKRLACCVPWYGAGAFRHSRDCAGQPNAKLSPEERRMLADRAAHPAGQPSRMAVWRSHAPGCGCADCRYVEAMLDRDD